MFGSCGKIRLFDVWSVSALSELFDLGGEKEKI